MVTRTGEREIGAVFGRVGMYASYGDDVYLLLFHLGASTTLPGLIQFQ